MNAGDSNESADGEGADGRVAFEALQSLARQTRRHARGLPAQVNITPHWSGIGFELLGQRFVTPLGEFSEMLEVPGYTRLPGVQPWVKGVANVRGRLLPLCDLAAFFDEQITSPRKKRRVLVLENDDLYTGLIVDQVFGMQHFPVDSFDSQSSLEHPRAIHYTAGSYRHKGFEWTVFSARRLTENANFMNAASA